MQIYNFFGIAAGAFSVIAFIPYISAIFHGETKPSGPSWWTWTFITCIMTASSWVSGATSQVLILPVWLCFSQFVVAILSVAYGNNMWDFWNKINIAGAVLSVGIWLISGNSLFALAMSIIADALASIPNFRHVWLNPEEENRIGWTFGFGSAVFEIFAVSQWSFAESGFAVYFLLNMAIVLILVWRPVWIKVFEK